MNTSTEELRKTPLYDMHLSFGARMVAFAGYSMPVQYRDGIMKEHIHTRQQAGLFDVSHMGQIRLTGKGLCAALETLLPLDLESLAPDHQSYSLLMNDAGGIRDDLMIANCGDHHLMVVNAACKDADFAYLRDALPAGIEIELLNDRALIALQGPMSREVIKRLNPDIAALRFMQTGDFKLAGRDCWVSCSGYTGEDGFEISASNSDIATIVELLTAQTEVAPIGLGARDSLRLEAGLCLYGHDLDETTSPIEASLSWAISKARRPGALRAGGYPGANRVAAELENGATRRRVLLDVEGRAPVRDGSPVKDAEGKFLGRVCSGGFGPSVSRPIAMAYLEPSSLQAALFAEVRGKSIPLQLRDKPFVTPRYFRG